MHSWRKLAAPAVALAVATAALAGCGSSSKKSDTSSGTKASDSGSSAAPPVYTIKASEPGEKKFAFGVPTSIKGGVVTFVLDNPTKDRHDFQLASVDGNQTVADVVSQVVGENKPTPDWIHGEGGAGGANPAGSSKATVDLEPGRYIYFCTETTDDGTSHAASGMAGELTVAGNSGASMPSTDAVVKASEYTFDVPALEAGHVSFTFENAGKQIHHIVGFPVAKGHTFDEAKAAMMSDKEPTGPPPIDFEKGFASTVIDPGRKMVVETDLVAGEYVFACFMTDRGTAGPPHVAKGMIADVKVS